MADNLCTAGKSYAPDFYSYRCSIFGEVDNSLLQTAKDNQLVPEGLQSILDKG